MRVTLASVESTWREEVSSRSFITVAFRAHFCWSACVHDPTPSGIFVPQKVTILPLFHLPEIHFNCGFQKWIKSASDTLHQRLPSVTLLDIDWCEGVKSRRMTVPPDCYGWVAGGDMILL